MPVEDDCINLVVWQMDSRKKEITKIDKDLDKVLLIMVNTRKTYTKKQNKFNKVDIQHDKIQRYDRKKEQDLDISNKERDHTFAMLQHQAIKLQLYEKMIYIL